MATRAKNSKTTAHHARPMSKVAKDDKVTKLYKNGKNSANELYQEGKKKINDTQEVLQEYTQAAIKSIKRRPFSALLIASGFGFILGFILKNKK